MEDEKLTKRCIDEMSFFTPEMYERALQRLRKDTLTGTFLDTASKPDQVLTMAKLLDCRKLLNEMQMKNPTIVVTHERPETSIEMIKALADKYPVVCSGATIMHPAMLKDIERLFGKAPDNFIAQEKINGHLGSLMGMPVYVSPLMTEKKQLKFPKSKKKRIQKKWRKKYTVTVPSTKAYMISTEFMQPLGGLSFNRVETGRFRG